MSHVRPVARLVTDSLSSLPWNRSSIALGRPYNPQYRFRTLNHSSSRATHIFVTPSRKNYARLGQQNANSHRRVGSSFDPWEKPEGDEDDGEGEGIPRALVANKAFAMSRNTLVMSDDRSLQYDYDRQVEMEEVHVRGRTASEVYSILRVAACEGTTASIWKVQACVDYLIGELRERPNLRLYSALILANCRPDGTVAEVERLLQEMTSEGLELDIGACHDVLKVLSVHPDYVLRTEILQYMRTRWFELSEGGWHDVAAGLIREGSFEMAMDTIEEMRSQSVRTLGWLSDLLIYALAEKEELDEVFKLITQRVDEGDLNIGGTLWYYLLDVSSRNLHYDLASYIWKSRVQTSFLNPSAGICTSIMNLAARNGNTELAQHVLDFLNTRNIVLEAQHYEMMLEAYVNAGMPTNGLYVLSAMQHAGVVPNEGSTRPLFTWLKKQKPEMVETMFAELKHMLDQGRVVPVAAMNVLVETAAQHGNTDQAIDLYKLINETCGSPANLATFNTLFKLCRQKRRKDLAFMLASEMISLSISPDAMTYDRMMLVCLVDEDYEDGVSYYKEMVAKGFEPRFGSALVLVKMLARSGDERVYEILEELEAMDLPLKMTGLRSWVQENFHKGQTEAV